MAPTCDLAKGFPWEVRYVSNLMVLLQPPGMDLHERVVGKAEGQMVLLLDKLYGVACTEYNRA